MIHWYLGSDETISAWTEPASTANSRGSLPAECPKAAGWYIAELLCPSHIRQHVTTGERMRAV